MRTGPLHRDRRTVSRTGAAILVLLAALLHLMTCGHGPASPAETHTLQATTVAIGAGHSDPEHDPEEHCCHDDEPTIQAPRDAVVPLPSVHEAVPVTGVMNSSTPAQWPGLSHGARPIGLSIGRSLARLSVLRT